MSADISALAGAREHPSSGGSLRVYGGMLAFCASSSILMTYIGFVLPAVLRQAGQPAEVVGIVALAYLPYALRILWAPLVDRSAVGSPSRYKAIAVLALALAIASMAAFLPFRPERDVAAIISVACLVFFFLATGLTALDGYVLATLGEDGRKRVTAWQAAGFTLGGIVLGIGAMAADGTAWTSGVVLLAAATGVLALPVLSMPKAKASASVAGTGGMTRGLWAFLKSAATRRRIAVSLLAHGGLGLVAGYMPVLQVDSGLSPGQVGLFGAVGSNICGFIAALAAGAAVIRLGGWRTLAVISVVSVGFFVFAALFHAELSGPIFAVSLSLGVMALGYCYVVPYRALVLIACGGERGATQAAFLSSLDVVVAIVFGSLAGIVATAFSLTGLFSLSAGLCAAGALIAARAILRSDEIHPRNQEGGKP